MLASNDPRLRCLHQLEAVSATPPDELKTLSPAPAPTTVRVTTGKIFCKQSPFADVDVNVDDFLLLAQTLHQRQRVMRATLTSIDEVLRPLAPDNPVTRKEPAQVKKMLKGDACWSTTKQLIGWDEDSEALPLNLPPHRLERLREVLQWL
jgi:hypothetical protein